MVSKSHLCGLHVQAKRGLSLILDETYSNKYFDFQVVYKPKRFVVKIQGVKV